MWCSTPWPKPERPPSTRRDLLRAAGNGAYVAFAAACAAPAWANPANPAPAGKPPLTHLGPTLWPRGEGGLRFLGLSVYSARLWVAEGFELAQFANHPLALELTYSRDFSARQIAERSLQEMERQLPIKHAEKAIYMEKMAAIFPDVKAGDRLLGVHRPGQGALFVAGAQPGARTLGAVDDPTFSQLFFGIWLSGATSEPKLRQALLAAG